MRMGFWGFLFSFLFIFPNFSYAQESCQLVFSTKSVAKRETRFGSGYSAAEFDKQQGLRLFVWNVHKAADENLAYDFADVAPNSDLVLFQEVVDKPSFVKSLLRADPKLNWTMSRSFKTSEDGYTGVATASKVQPISETTVLSNPTEPILDTHKTMLVSEFAVAGQSQKLLVVNIHAINFVLNSEFEAHMHQVYQAIKNHKGPVILAGDFNTWNSGRMEHLIGLTMKLGLKRPRLPREGFLELDHVFIRGFQVKQVYDLNYIESSDHAPLLLDLEWL